MWILAILVLGLVPPGRSQNLTQSDTVRIEAIRIYGNVKTHAEIILRELEFGPGDRVTRSDLQKAKNRIENLRLFNRVDFRLHRKGKKADLEIQVWERMSVFPVPILFMNERSWKKWSYGFGVYNTNFRGRGEELWLGGWLGYNPGFEFRYNNRWFGGARRLYARAQLLWQTQQSKEPDYRDVGEKHRMISGTLGKRFGFDWYLDVTGAYDRISIPVKRLQWNPAAASDRTVSVAVQLKWDSRDIWDYPHRGHLWTVTASRFWLWGKARKFDRLKLDLREYRSIRGVIFAGRVVFAASDGTVPSYQRLYFGYEERVRGHFFEIFSGTGQAFAGAELRIPVLRNHRLQLPSPPEYKFYFQQMKYSIYLTVFHDHGAVWASTGSVKNADWISGSGAGLNFVLPYSSTLRLEYAWNDAGRGEMIADFVLAF